MRNRLAILLCLLAGQVFAGAYDSIIQAALNDRSEEVIDYLQRGLDVNTAAADGNSLLALAARNGNLPLVEFLIKNRANVHRRNIHGDTALLLATSQGHQAVVERLLAAGAEINPEGWTPLHYSVVAGHLPLTRYLVSHGAELDRRAPNGRTAFLLACQTGRLDQLRLLAEAGADWTLTDFEGKSAIEVASEKGFAELVNFLQPH